MDALYESVTYSALGAKGMGEIGLIGTPAAIGNAIFHATGIRLTSLPFRIDSLLAQAGTTFA